MIEAFFGLPGAGKTYAMTRVAMKMLRKGRDVYANYHIEPSSRDRGQIYYFSQITEVLDKENCVVLIDEAGTAFPAHMWNKMPTKLMQGFREHRHNKMDMFYTAQDMQDVAAVLRRLTQFRNECSKIGPFMSIKTYGMRDKKKYGGSFHVYDSSISARYDTHAARVEIQNYVSAAEAEIQGKRSKIDIKV